jgi:NADH:ubiquinone oxidoreductase subunit F (NADH-binding)
VTAEPAYDVPSPPAGAARLLPGSFDRLGLDEHLAGVGPLPYRGGRRMLIRTVEASGLTGRGGAGFPVARKLHAVANQPGTKVVVANGSEGEPASGKDRVLLTVNPHLVLDGLQLAAEAVGAQSAYLYLHPSSDVIDSVRQALDARRRARVDAISASIVESPQGFVVGEESAVVAAVSGGAALPTSKPPMVFERGVRGRPTLVQNVETLAHLALVARFGADWFRSVGATEAPGTMLFTISGSVRHPGVVETPTGATFREVVDAAGGLDGPAQAVLVGGYHGTWLTEAAASRIDLRPKALATHGAKLGAGVLVVLPADACGLAESARIARYLAGESAGQCGPCVFGLPSISQGLDALAGGYAAPEVRTEIERRCALVEDRGACHHPDGTARFVRSVLRIFRDEIGRHAVGGCTATRRQR